MHELWHRVAVVLVDGLPRKHRGSTASSPVQSRAGQAGSTLTVGGAGGGLMDFVCRGMGDVRFDRSGRWLPPL